MSLHRMNSITIGVPDVAKTAEFYRDFNLTETSPGVFATADGGEQLRLVQTPLRRLVELNDRRRRPRRRRPRRLAARRARCRRPAHREWPRRRSIPAPASACASRSRRASQQETVAPTPYNGPGRIDRTGRAPKLSPDGKPGRRTPRKLGHVVVGTTELEPSKRFFIEGIGFKLSDELGHGATSCAARRTTTTSSCRRAAAVPAPHLVAGGRRRRDRPRRATRCSRRTRHGTSGASAGTTSARTSSGTSATRPATSASTTADMDCIPDDQMWKPQVWEGMRALYSWGPPPPPSFLRPDDLAELMAGLHSAKA